MTQTSCLRGRRAPAHSERGPTHPIGGPVVDRFSQFREPVPSDGLTPATYREGTSASPVGPVVSAAAVPHRVAATHWGLLQHIGSFLCSRVQGKVQQQSYSAGSAIRSDESPTPALARIGKPMKLPCLRRMLDNKFVPRLSSTIHPASSRPTPLPLYLPLMGAGISGRLARRRWTVGILGAQ